MSKYGVFSSPYFPVFSPNTEKCGPGKTAYLGTFHAVLNNLYFYIHRNFLIFRFSGLSDFEYTAKTFFTVIFSSVVGARLTVESVGMKTEKLNSFYITHLTQISMSECQILRILPYSKTR